MNDRFFALPEERQMQIINAAYEVFAQNSYKNASMSRLADAGGVSKSLLFHYFLNKKELYLYLWEHAGRRFHEAVMECHMPVKDFFDVIYQRVRAMCVFMREVPTIYIFTLRALFEENQEIKEILRHNDMFVFGIGTDDIAFLTDMDSFRSGIDIQLLLEEINGYLLSCYWQMFSSGKLDPDCLERDFLKRIKQWKTAYLKEEIVQKNERLKVQTS